MAKVLRGFALLKAEDPERLRLTATKGGARSQVLGTGHRWTAKEAKHHATQGAKARWAHKEPHA